MNPIRSFFQQTALVLLNLLRHLIIQTLILAFVLVDVHIHRLFIDRAIDTEKSVFIKKPVKGAKRQLAQRAGNKAHKRLKRSAPRIKTITRKRHVRNSGN